MTGTAELIRATTRPLPGGGASALPDPATLAVILDQLPAIVRVIALDGTFLLSTGQRLMPHGQHASDRIGQSAFAFFADRPDILAHLRRALAGEEFQAVIEHRGIVWECWFTPLIVGGALLGTLYVTHDITAQARAEAALRAGEARYRALHAAAERQAQELRLLDRVRTALARTLDPAEVCRVVVEAIAATFGYTQVSLYLREGDAHVLQHQVGYDRVLARIPVTAGVSGRAVAVGQPLLIADVAADPDFLGAIDGLTSEICIPLFDEGRPAGFLNIESSGVRLDEDDLRLMAALGEQVGIALERARLHAALREREERLAHLALHDPLTGLPNRRGLGEALARALARHARGGPRPALLYLDLDGFKDINDSYGHAAGDALLVALADRLRACARAGDLPGRLGGDEFAVVLDGVTEGEARAVADRLVATLADPLPLGAATIAISASVGAALAAPGETADDLLRRADAALYRAKRAGKNRACFQPAADPSPPGGA